MLQKCFLLLDMRPVLPSLTCKLPIKRISCRCVFLGLYHMSLLVCNLAKGYTLLATSTYIGSTQSTVSYVLCPPPYERNAETAKNYRLGNRRCGPSNLCDPLKLLHSLFAIGYLNTNDTL
jgi:hypothetical protein